MEIILLKDLESLGYIDDVVKVKTGYARNYLIPKGIGVLASGKNLEALQDRLKVREEKEKEVAAQLQSISDKLQETTVEVTAKTGTSGKIFGSITTLQLADAIKKQLGVELDRKVIQLPDEIKTLGEYIAKVKLTGNYETEIKFEVKGE